MEPLSNCVQISEFEMLFDRDVTSQIFHKLAPADLRCASQVCRNWREVANDQAQLQSWTFDDNIADVVGTKASLTPMKPKTPLPKHWVNPTAFSPLASFKTPRSLNSLLCPSPIARLLESAGTSTSSSLSGSPHTPSPIQSNIETGRVFSDIVRHNMKSGRYLGDVDISSSRLSDKNVQLILRSCPNLHTLRLQHICRTRQYLWDRVLVMSEEFTDMDRQNTSPQLRMCGCGQITEKAFSNIAKLCPNIGSVTLVLQHIAYRKVLRTTLAEIGALPKLHTLSLELRMPSFGSSMRSENYWLGHLRCGDSEVSALLEAGPPPLQALALNRCDLSEQCVAALAAACPKLEAIDLNSPDLQILGWSGMVPAVGVQLKALTNLTAGAFGVFMKLDDCHFGTWFLPALNRLRLETREPLSSHHLRCLTAACPKLESLHLIWDSYGGSREAHIYPLTETNILDYQRNL